MFERKYEELAPVRIFIKRVTFCTAISTLLIVFALLIGIVGYHYIAGLRWIDSLLNASMILSGMGPIDKLYTDKAKVFASAYALFSGLVFVAALGIIFSPILHRIMHRFHIDKKDLKN
jgi:hypothetical protein